MGACRALFGSKVEDEMILRKERGQLKKGRGAEGGKNTYKVTLNRICGRENVLWFEVECGKEGDNKPKTPPAMAHAFYFNLLATSHNYLVHAAALPNAPRSLGRFNGLTLARWVH
jgi:hypothetical protein